MKTLLVLSLFVMTGFSFASAFAYDEASLPICERVAVSFRSDKSARVDPDTLRKAEDFMLEKLADRGYLAKYVTFYAPGEPLPVSPEAEIKADAEGQPRVLVEISYTEELLTRNLALRIYRLNSKPPYSNLPLYNGNETIGPVVFGPKLKSHFRKLIGSPKMLDCAAL